MVLDSRTMAEATPVEMDGPSPTETASDSEEVEEVTEDEERGRCSNEASPTKQRADRATYVRRSAGGGLGLRDVDAIRAVLAEHMTSMKFAWGDVVARVEGLEHRQSEQAERLAKLVDGHNYQERRAGSLWAKIGIMEKKMDMLSKELDLLRANAGKGGMGVWTGDRDLKAPGRQAFLRRSASGACDGGGWGGGGHGSEGGLLREEDRRTLIVGGWLRDTRKETILEEAKEGLGLEAVRPRIDSSDLVVFGPRKSFGMLRFGLREGETKFQLRERMWSVVKAVREAAIPLKSTDTVEAAPKKLWASFVKTREARQRGGHACMVRRVAQTCVEEATGEVQLEAKSNDFYEVDWVSGTVWAGQHKLGSSVHRMPRRDGVCQMPGGWVDVNEMSEAIGVEEKVERELARASWPG